MPSLYGRGSYGKGLYSQSTVSDLAGDLAPSVVLAGNLDIQGQVFIGGNLRPTVALGGSLTALRALGGGMRPQVTFWAHVGADVDLDGGMTLGATLAGGVPAVGPLWTPVPACPDPEWEEAELCNG